MAKKEMGEFEERPVVKPAVEVPIERRRPTGLIVAVVVLSLMVLGMGAYIIWSNMTEAKSDIIHLQCDDKLK